VSQALDAIILAGGKGTRLRSVVADRPKPLAQVDGKPFLDILLEQLAAFAEVRTVVLATGYLADMIRERYEGNRRFGFEIRLSPEEQPLGTGGALLAALPMVESDNILVLNGDSYVDVDLRRLVSFHASQGAALTMTVVEVVDTSRYGSVELDSSKARVVGFTEKGDRGGPGFINAGCYLFSREVLSTRRRGPSSLERDIIPELRDGTFAYVSTGRFIDIGTPESYRQAPEYLR
jgi:NDP-sugar pyrophosphorylase family protein